jgi:hypothetical protein
VWEKAGIFRGYYARHWAGGVLSPSGIVCNLDNIIDCVGYEK